MKSDTISFFSSLEDPRLDRCKAHALTDIVFLTLCAVLAGCESWDDIADFGAVKIEWLRKFVQLPNGIPSHDTLNRVFALLDPDALQKCFLDWVREVAELTSGSVVAIDGKRMNNAGVNGKKAIVHMVHAWNCANHLLLGQVKTEAKTNEIKAIPTLLDVLSIQGCIVTIDAMGCQRQIAAKIKSKEADYVLTVKGNQSLLERDLERAFLNAPASDFSLPDRYWEKTECGHGRVEYRCCRVLPVGDYVVEREQWAGLKTLVQTQSRVTDKKTGKESAEVRYFISSLEPDASQIANAVRAHWSVENNLHWCLDVIFNEDGSTKQAGNAAQNFGLIVRMALALLKKEKTSKRSLKGKRLRAAFDDHYLLKILDNL